ncbi:MAG: hypothetical protein M1839_006729 [Geoglossum umbratile]|nr:MAG: hypothetical protein M1839_006729 [Geoglossum umbratile]
MTPRDDRTIRDKGESTALHLAASIGNKATVQVLLEGGAEMSAEGYHNMTPLHNAVSAGHEAVGSLLLSEGADPEDGGSAERSALELSQLDKREAVEQLMRSHIEQRRVQTG